MATESFRKNIVIQTPQAAETFIAALETAVKQADNTDIGPMQTRTISREEIQEKLASL